MIESIVYLLIAFPAGIALGLFYFAGLWMTVQRLPSARRPALLTFGSLFLRLSICVLGFYLVMGGRWDRLISALLGFLLMRRVLVRRWGEAPQPQVK